MCQYGKDHCALHISSGTWPDTAEKRMLHTSFCQVSDRMPQALFQKDKQKEKQKEDTIRRMHPGQRPVQGNPSRKALAQETAKAPLRSFLHGCSFSLVVLLPLLLCSCALSKNTAQAPDEQKIVDQSLNDAANVIMADLARLTGSYQSYDASHATSPLQERMNLRFEGPLQEALGRVCAQIGYRLVIVGTPRPAPVLVHVQARETPVLHILRELGLQTGPYEQIRVVEEGRFIELTWLDPATNLPNRYGPAKKKRSKNSTKAQKR